MNKKKLTRRQFLKTATMASGATIFPYVITSPALGNSDVPPASERITIGHIGVGGMGGAHVKAFLRHPDAQVVAVCDPFKSRCVDIARRVGRHYFMINSSASYECSV